MDSLLLSCKAVDPTSCYLSKVVISITEETVVEIVILFVVANCSVKASDAGGHSGTKVESAVIP